MYTNENQNHSSAPINAKVLVSMYFKTAAPYWVTLVLLPTERTVTPEPADNVRVLVPLFMNSCSLPMTMPVYAMAVITTGEAETIGLKRFRCVFLCRCLACLSVCGFFLYVTDGGKIPIPAKYYQ